MLPEQEDVEWHSDRIPLSTDPNGLQDARVSQLAADQVVLEHAWLLNADVNTYQKKCHYLRDTVRLHSRMQMIISGNTECLKIYLHVIWLNAANKKGVAPEM